MDSKTKEKNESFSLRPKARILKTLGQELISSETVALIELVKNSYDADSKNVLIEFSGELIRDKGCISVYDDGCGMSLNVIKDSWMTIATSNKKHNTVSQNRSRRVLGEKGIGRFSTSRISKELELISKTSLENKEIYTFFDWKQFDNDDLFLDEVQFLTEERTPTEITDNSPIKKLPTSTPDVPSGTVLKMSQLNHTWEKNDFLELERGLSRLISPFKPINDFNIYIKGIEDNKYESFRIEPPEIIKYPHYKISGEVKDNGKYEFNVHVAALGIDHFHKGFYCLKKTKDTWKVQTTNIDPSEFDTNAFKPISCGGFSFELLVWDRDDLNNVNQKIGSGLRSIRADLDSIAGINIYRDGFRVLPYGEPNNDWLRLDLRRVQTPAKRISNNQITGYVSISADNNPDLHDRSNREGLDNNVAYSDLTQIMQLILFDFESIRYLARRPKKSASDSSASRPRLFEKPDLSAVKQSLENKSDTPEDTLKLISKVELDWNIQIKNIQDVLSKYHSLATLGGLIDKVLHNGRQPLASIQMESGLGQEFVEDLIENEDEEPISLDSLKTIEMGFGKIASQALILHDVFRRIEPFGGRKKGRPKKYYIEDLIADNFDNFKNELEEENISVTLPTSQTLVSTDVTEMSEIFTNLITNSIYWLGQTERSGRNISVQLDRLTDGAIEIRFADTGPGIDDSIKDHIFEPYVSKRPDGHGLGLCMVGEILKDYYDGSVELMDSGRDGGAVFRLILRRRV